MRVFARLNQIGWIHLWRTQEAFEIGEASDHFFDARTDPRWQGMDFPEDALDRLKAGELVEVEDPGYFEDESGTES